MSEVLGTAWDRREAEIRERIARLRDQAARLNDPMRVAEALASVFEPWRDRDFPGRRRAIAAIAAASGWSERLLDESIDALLAPFSRDELESFAAAVAPHSRVGGFIMPANIPGSGMNEVVTALLSGAGAMVKTSNREPVFFRELAHSLKETDPEIGSLLEVITFGRERGDLTELMKRECDFIVAMGDDATLAHLSGGARMFGFGSRASGALISIAAPANVASIATAIARDVTLFEQRGCLSPHHVFVEDSDGSRARDFARALGDALDSIAATLAPARLSFHAAAAIRRIRESARWRGLGARGVELHEGAEMAWSVVFDRAARFTISPGYRTVTVTPVQNWIDLESRLAPVAGRVEAFALAVPAQVRARWLDVLGGAGVTYVCDPGRMQSPPLLWPHGGGAFLDFISA